MMCVISVKLCSMREALVGLTLVFLSAEAIATGPSEIMSDRFFIKVWGKYNRDIRPVCGDFPATVQARMGLGLRQLIDIDEPKQLLVLSVWIRLRWYDCRLTWNKSDYGGLPRIVVPQYLVWTPDLTLYENVHSQLGDVNEHRITVDYTGQVHIIAPAVITSFCKLNVQDFPFDSQYCRLGFGSWVYNGYELNISGTHHTTDLSHFIEHGEWEIVGTHEERTEEFFNDIPYSEEVFTIHLRRRSGFYVVILILPSVLLQSLSIAGFLLPPESGEKVCLEITVLLSLSVFQLVILETMPSTSDHIPILAICLMVSMALITLSCIATVFVLRIHFANHLIEVPYQIRAIMISWFGRLFGVDTLITAAHINFTVYDAYLSGSRNPNFSEEELDWRHVSRSVNRDRLVPIASAKSNRESGVEVNEPKSVNVTEMQQLINTSKKMLACLIVLSDLKEKKNHHKLVEDEWRILAVFLDRLFLAVFLFFWMILTVLIMFILFT